MENVQRYTHPGHIINYNTDDSLNTGSRKHKFIGQVNDVLCYFKSLDCNVRNSLIQTHCISIYGCELRMLQHDAIGELAMA